MFLTHFQWYRKHKGGKWWKVRYRNPTVHEPAMWVHIKPSAFYDVEDTEEW